MNKPNQMQYEKPMRADNEFNASILKANLEMRLGMVLLFVICIVMGWLLYLSNKKPRLIAVIDSSTGQTYGAIASTDLSHDILNRQLVYYSRVFCENYLNHDHVQIRDARKTALELVHPTMLLPKIPKDFLDDAQVHETITNRATSSFDWKVKPVVTSNNDPRYSVFCQFTRTIHRMGYDDQTQLFNIRLDWGRLQHDQDAFNRPHSLVLVNFLMLDANSDELKNQLNLIK